MPPVYHPPRLQVVRPMVTEEGTVLTDPVHQAGGDAPFEFQIQGTDTVRHVEVRCVYAAEFEAAREACRGYYNHVLIPHAGDHVRITGPLVRDLVHDAEFPNLGDPPCRQDCGARVMTACRRRGDGRDEQSTTGMDRLLQGPPGPAS